MATKKDLVEAHSFSRRRLVTAFISGAPGGREVEPSRPGRTIVGGIALSVLLIAGAAIASVLAARTPEDWNKPGLILSQENSALYVILKESDPPELRPVANATSAQLIFGADKRATTVARATVDEQTPGETIGIFNAPYELPTTDHLINTGWTACTGDGLGIKVNVDTRPGASLGTGVTIRTDGGYFVVMTGADQGGPARAHSYFLPDGPGADKLLSDLKLPVRANAMNVPGDWQRLFEPGGTLGFESFGFDSRGQLPPDLRTIPGAEVGDYIEKDDGSGGGVALTPGGVLNLDAFALVVYRNSAFPGTQTLPSKLPVPVPTADATRETFDAALWPRQVVQQATPASQACAALVAEKDQRPAVQLRVEPDENASAADVATPTDRPVRVLPGNGAFVYSGTFDDASSETPWVVDAKGDLYPLANDETISRLGYAGVDAPLVPDTWIKLFNVGVPLSTSAALCPPIAPSSDAAARDANRAGTCGSLDAG